MDPFISVNDPRERSSSSSSPDLPQDRKIAGTNMAMNEQQRIIFIFMDAGNTVSSFLLNFHRFAQGIFRSDRKKV